VCSFIKCFCDTIFPNALTEDETKTYISSNGTLPMLHIPQPFGSAMQARSHDTGKRIRDRNRKRFSEEPTKPSAWATPPQFIFEDKIAFPDTPAAQSSTPYQRPTQDQVNNQQDSNANPNLPLPSNAPTIASTDESISRLDSFVGSLNSNLSQLQMIVENQSKLIEAQTTSMNLNMETVVDAISAMKQTAEDNQKTISCLMEIIKSDHNPRPQHQTNHLHDNKYISQVNQVTSVQNNIASDAMYQSVISTAGATKTLSSRSQTHLSAQIDSPATFMMLRLVVTIMIMIISMMVQLTSRGLRLAARKTSKDVVKKSQLRHPIW
jgi:acyl-CoA hydrolase